MQGKPLGFKGKQITVNAFFSPFAIIICIKNL